MRILDTGTRPGDDPDLVVRKRTAVATALVAGVASFIYIAIGLNAGVPVVVALATLNLVGQVVNVVVFHFTGRIGPLVTVEMALGLLVIVGGAAAIGGITQGGGMVWVLLVPMGGVLLLGGRAGQIAYAAVIVAVGIGFLLEPLVGGEAIFPRWVLVTLTAVNLLVTSAVALGLVRFIDGERLAAKQQSDTLLLNVLPAPIADRLKHGERVIADHHEQASVLFSDIVDFTPLSETRPAQEVVSILNALFTQFDRLADRFGLEKIKTIGDAYMLVAGVPEPRHDHAEALMRMAIEMHRHVAEHPDVDGRRLQIRTGIASGPLVAGVIGERKFSYDLWGDTVNVASRMESSGIPGTIQVTEETRRLLVGPYPLERRDGVEVKGKGVLTTWTLDPARMDA